MQSSGIPFRTSRSLTDAVRHLFDALFRAHLAGAYAGARPAAAARARRAGRRAPARPRAERRSARRAASSARTSAAIASTTGRAPAAIACRAAPPWPTPRSSPPCSSASIARRSTCASSPPTAAPPSSPPRASRSTSPSLSDRHVRSRRRTDGQRSTVDGTRDAAPARTAAPSSWRCRFARSARSPNERLLLTLRLFAGDGAAGALPRRRRARRHRPRRRIRGRELVGVAASAARGLPRLSASRTSAA